MEDALDVHISWHLNKRVPVAFTSGQVQVVNEIGRLIAGSMDNLVWTDNLRHASPLIPADAYCRPGAKLALSSANFIRQDPSTIGKWFWSPTSGLMFRRSVMELVSPDRFQLGRWAGDTYFAFACHAMGGSLLIDQAVASYRRHGGNAFSDMAVYGAGTMAVRDTGSNWRDVRQTLLDHISDNYHEIVRHIHIAHVANISGSAPNQQEPDTAIPPMRDPRPWVKPLAELSCTIGRASGARWLVQLGEWLWAK